MSLSSFCDPHHKYIIIGDLRIIENKKFRNLPTKGPNCREPWTINFSKASVEINIAVDTCIEVMALKTMYTASKFTPWKEEVLASIIEKITA